MKEEITVVACHPGKPAVITNISSSLESMRQFVAVVPLANSLHAVFTVVIPQKS